MAAHAESSHVNTTTTTTKHCKTTKTTETTTGELTSSASSQKSNSKNLRTTSSSKKQFIPATPPSSKPSRFPSTVTISTTTTIPTIPTSRAKEEHFKVLGLVVCYFQILHMGLFGLVYWLLIKRSHRHRPKRRYIQRKESQTKYQPMEQQDEQQRQKEQLPDAIVNLRRYHPYQGPKQKRWLALVRWDPHLFPPFHRYHILEDRQGLKRFIKAENLLPSDKPRKSPPKISFASTVGIKFIPNKHDPINTDAWNLEYHRQVAVNSHWQHQQWRKEQEGKNKHRRLVVSSIAMRHFRRSVLSTLIDHGQRLRVHWTFHKIVLPRLVEHAHKLRWKWALKRHHSKAPFQECTLSALPRHRQRLLLKWQTKKFFSRTVAPTLADHSIRLRLKWALIQAQQQDEELGCEDYDDFSNSGNDDDEGDDECDDDGQSLQIWALQHQHARAKFREEVLGFLESHCKSLRLRWGFRKLFRQTVVPALADHLLQMRFEWALRYADWQDREREEDDDGFYDDDDDDDDDDRNDDDDYRVEAASTTTTTTRLHPQTRRCRNTPSTTDGATVWIDGRRRSTRNQPKLGSLYENGIRRSARFL